MAFLPKAQFQVKEMLISHAIQNQSSVLLSIDIFITMFNINYGRNRVFSQKENQLFAALLTALNRKDIAPIFQQ